MCSNLPPELLTARFDNVKPVDEPTAERVLVSHHLEAVVRPTKARIDRRAVKCLSPRALLVITYMASGDSVGQVHNRTGIDRRDLARVVKWIGEIYDVKLWDLREFCQNLPNGADVGESIRQYLLSGGRVAREVVPC